MKTNAQIKPSRLDQRVQYDAIGDLRAVIADCNQTQITNIKWLLKKESNKAKELGLDFFQREYVVIRILTALVAQTAYEVAQEAAQEAA